MNISRPVLVLLLLLCIAGRVPTSLAQASPTPSEWWPQVEKLQEILGKEQWKRAYNTAEKLGGEVREGAWHHPDLGRVLAEIDFCQAIAAAWMDQDEEAVWLWHTALSLDRSLAGRDLAPYGKAGRLLIEFPLRKHREVPAGWKVARPPFDRSFAPPKEPKDAPLAVLANTGAARERPHPVRAEVLIDTEGRPRFPVVLSPDLHPILVDAALRYLHAMPPWTPARLDGGPTAILFDIEMSYRVAGRGR